MTSSNGRAGSPIILLNDGVATPQAHREREAHARLEYLEKLKPANAAPLTDEDLAIVEAALARRGSQFATYMRYAYVDYCLFFISAVTDERNDALEKLT